MGSPRNWWAPRYELTLVRSDATDVPVLLVGRHRIRIFAEWSRRLEQDHLRLLPGCDLVVLDSRRTTDRHAPADVTPLPAREVQDRLAA
jgi:hypothetical protein